MSGSFSLWLVPRLYRFVLSSILATCRVRYLGRDHVRKLEAEGRTWIYTAWHENTASSVALERGRRLAMMASDSRDGEYIARGIEEFGNIPVRGSSSKGGAKAAKMMARLLRSGHSAAVTPDGPRGPRRVLQPGVLSIAALSGAPLVPYHVAATREWEFRRTWDCHRLPKPFSTVYVGIGEPYVVDRRSVTDAEPEMVADFGARMARNAEQTEIAARGR